MEIPILSLLGLFLKGLQFSGFTESAVKLISKRNELESLYPTAMCCIDLALYYNKACYLSPCSCCMSQLIKVSLCAYPLENNLTGICLR